MSKLKTAVIGVGSLGRHHLRWLARLPQSQLVGLHDVDRAKAAQYAGEYGVTAFESLDDLASSVEAASVAVTTSAHYEVAAHLIERGVHCLIEKPIAPDLNEAARLQEMADRRGVKVTVGQIERFNPAVRALEGMAIHPSFIEAHRLAAELKAGTVWINCYEIGRAHV